MSATKTYARSRSLPPRAHLDRPHPVQDGVTPSNSNSNNPGSVAAARTRSPVPRAVSIPNLQSGAVINTNSTFLDLRDSILVDEEAEAAFRDIAREQIDAATLRELARFFRTTEPPSRAPSFDVGGNDCLGTSAMTMRGDRRRWSIQSLRKRRGRRTTSLTVQLPETAVPKTTSAGHSYIAISVGEEGGVPAKKNSDIAGRRLSQLRLSIPRHGRLSNLTMSGLTIPNELEWLKDAEAMREQQEEEEAAEKQTVRSQSTGPKDMPQSPTITVVTPPSTEPMTPLTALSSHPPHPPIPERPPSAERPPPRQMMILSEAGSPVMPLKASPESKISFNIPPTSPTESQRPSSSSSAPPKLLAHRRQLSAFPNTSPKSSSSRRSASPRSPSPISSLKRGQNPQLQKQQIQNQGHLQHPQPKKPANIVVKGRLEVPQTNQLPDSPGFPTMLAAMTFPSPPETSPVHSPSNSISSLGSARPVSPTVTAAAAAATARRTSSRAMLESSLDQRVMQPQQDSTQPARPPLRKYRSDGGPLLAFTSQKSIASSVGTYHGDAAELAVAQTAEICGHPSSSSAAAAEETTPQETTTTTIPVVEETQTRLSDCATDSEQFETASESYRHSLKSDTTETSVSTATSGVRGRERERSSESMDILQRKRSSRLHRQSWTSVTDDDDRRTAAESERSERSSIMSASSSGTVKTSTSSSVAASDRRMARKAKIREKFQRDLNATKASTAAPRHPDQPAATVFMDSVDSPVLGRFPQSAAGGALPLRARRTSVPGPSPLAAQSASDSDEQESWSRHVSRRSSAHDIAQLIPHTVHEDAASASPTTPRAPVNAENEDAEKGAETPRALTFTSVMVVASIETSAPSTPSTTALRPLSLLNHGVSPPIPPPRLSLRSEGKASVRQRPLPIKIATGTKPNRKSVPNMPTPPLSAESPASLRRMSLPTQKVLPQTTSHPWARQSLVSSLPDTSPSSREKETQWLLAHQRETAQEWRLAALKERTRLERLAEEKEAATLEENEEEAEEEEDDDDNDEEEVPEKSEVPRTLRERNSSRSIASSTTKTNNRKDTLDLLNTNAARTNSGPASVKSDDGTASRSGTASPMVTEEDAAVSPAPQPQPASTLDPSIEERLKRLERNGDVWLSVVMPLLQDMNRMLRDLKRESVGEDMTMKIMDSALAAGLASVPTLAAAATAGQEEQKQEQATETDDATKT